MLRKFGPNAVFDPESCVTIPKKPFNCGGFAPKIRNSKIDTFSTETGRLMSANKIKTHKGTKKRFKITATGKVMHRASGTSHRNVRLSQKRKRNLRGIRPLAQCMEKSVKLALGKYSY